MAVFRTTDGLEWTLAVNVGTIKRVRELTGVQLLSLLSDTVEVSGVFSDDVRLAEVIEAVIRPQLEKAGKTADDFFSVIDGTVVEQAAEALLREVANFFQEPKRTVLLAAMDKVMLSNREKMAAGAAAALKAVEEMETPSVSTLMSSVSSSPASAA